MEQADVIDRTEAASVRRRGRMPVAEEIEQAVLDISKSHPSFGQARVALELGRAGHRISPSGVRYVWQRHNLETTAKRVSAFEADPSMDGTPLNGSQRVAIERVRAEAATNRELERRTAYDRRELILSAAAGLFRRQGYVATSMRDIASAAKLVPGSLYHHFSSKEDLLFEIHKEGIERITAAIERVASPHQDPWQRLEAACRAHLEELVEGGDFSAVVAAFTLRQDRTGKLMQRLAPQRRTYERRFKALVDALPIEPDVDRRMLRLQLLGALNWTLTWYQPGTSTPADLARQLTRLIRNGASAGPN
jgi:AcrR family transcriptional regulator